MPSGEVLQLSIDLACDWPASTDALQSSFWRICSEDLQMLLTIICIAFSILLLLLRVFVDDMIINNNSE